MWTICGIKDGVEFYDRFKFKSDLQCFIIQNKDILNDVLIFPPEADNLTISLDDFLED